MTAAPEWLDVEDAVRCHEQLAAQFGGSPALGDRWSLEFALSRVPNLFAHGKQDPAELAAAYAQAILRSGPFAEGNARTALVLACLFLAQNGVALDLPQEEAVVLTEGLAAGEVAAASFASWLRRHARPR